MVTRVFEIGWRRLKAEVSLTPEMALGIVFLWLGANIGCCFTRSDIELHFPYHWFNVHGSCNKFKFDTI